MSQARGILSRCTLLFLCLRLCFCQHDCTGVDCPPLENCIEEALDSGACCASCLKKGCTCEGYQYYDCINAGFKNGKVPEGDSYFVDYGSTECSCPVGGGRISCHFNSCPEMPPNCIEVLEPADGCMQCERVGCVQNGQKYEAGHSFHIDPCQVCHCPNEGGKLMCYPVPNCDPHKVDTPMFAAPTEDNAASRRDTYPYGFDQHPHTDQTYTEYQPLANGNLPVFKLDKEATDDYDYDPTDFSENSPQSLVLPTLSSSPPPSSYPLNKVVSLYQESIKPNRTFELQSPSRHGKLELREQYGVRDYPAGSVKVTEDPLGIEQSTAGSHMYTSTPEQNVLASFGDEITETDYKKSPHAKKVLDSVIFPLIKERVSQKNPDDLHVNTKSNVPPLKGTETKAHHQTTTDSPTPKGSNTLIHIGHPLKSTDSQNNQEKESDEVHFPLYDLTTEPPIHSQTSFTRQKESSKAYDVDDEEVKAKEDGEEEEIVTIQSVTEHKGKPKPHRGTLPHNERSHEDETSTWEPSTPFRRTSEYQTTPAIQFSSTTVQTSAMVKLGGSLLSEKPGKSPDSFHIQNGEKKLKEEETTTGVDWEHHPVLFIKHNEGPGVHGDDLVSGCCAAGQAWANQHRHCDLMPLLDVDEWSVCNVAQKQCCLISIKEAQCEAGVVSARRGDACQVEEKSCTDDLHQVCCSCCALGLRLRAEGRGCSAHQYLGYPCGHVFLTCCEEDQHLSQFPLRRKQKPRPTALPEKVSDSKFPKEAFSISTTDEAVNVVEEQEDVDECQLYGGQLCQHTCTNVWGSYRCGCHQGYILQPDGHSCAPVDPDVDNRVKEVDRPAAGPVPTTSLSPLTSTTTAIPIRVNPCAEIGTCSQQCTAVAGRARCSCFPGFRLMSDGRTCEDVDECLTHTHSCQRSEHCVNMVGSFVCELQVTCPAGYQLRNGVCEDVDECMLGNHNCGVGTVCENTVGSFLCSLKHKCMSGFAQDPHGNCVDINECSSLSEPCGSVSTCINTVGSYTCQKKTVACSHGYHAGPDGAKCVDTDECLMGTHRCGTGQICHNLPGTYRCDCQTGYQYDVMLKVCTDVNECWGYSGRLCAQTCENTPGSYRCSCTTGFSLAFDGKNCEDVNECEKKPCSQECANIYGSYQCYCHQGYFLKEDGHTCEDIDECSQSTGTLCAFQCVNVAGSYRCSCPPQGYVMSANGRTCTDIDECTTESHNCSVTQSCYNLQGSFRCLSFDCPPNYRKVSDTRCERNSCPVNSLDCQNSPVRITFYQLSFQTNIVVPAQIFRIGPSPAYSGDHIAISITKGNQDGYFSTRKLNGFTGAVYLQRQLRQPKDFVIDVEMKLFRQGALTSFLARIYVFITSSTI
ncbi:unnamed protein product [Ophioblennius macclurei]